VTVIRWESLATTPIDGRGEVVTLSATSTAQALVAYLAGPRFVQRVPRTHGMVRERVGGGPWRTRPADGEDVADVQEALEMFMREVGLPAPPRGDQWLLHLPVGVSGADLQVNGPVVVAAIRRRLEDLLGALD